MTVFNVRLGWWLRNPRWPTVWERPSGGLSLRELIGMHYNPLTRQYRLGRGVDVNYIAYTTRGD